MSDKVETITTANIASVWAALVDVTDWPRWTKSMTSVQRLDEGELKLGSRAKIQQPGMLTLVWQVDNWAEGTEFSWSTRSPGVRTTGHHRLRGNADGGTTITLEVEHHGPFAGLVRLLTGSRNRRYLAMEIAGLKAASEAEEESD